MHDIQGFVQRHLRRLGAAFREGVPAGDELVFVARNLLRHWDFLHKHAVGTVHRDALGIIDIVDDEVPFRPRDDADIVAHAGRRGLHIGQDAVGQDEGDGIGKVHAGVRFHALGLHRHDWGVAEHPDEVKAIDAEIQQGAAAQVRTHNAFLIAHAVSERRRHQPGRADASGLNQVPYHPQRGLVAGPDGLSQENLVLPGQVHNDFRLRVIGHESLLHQAGLSFKDRLFRNGEMMRMWRSDILGPPPDRR